MPNIAHIGQVTAFKELGIEFDISAPYSGCRLCGAVYQSFLDRALAIIVAKGLSPSIGLVEQGNDRRTRWREVHARRYHSSNEIESFAKTGLTFTPEAANRLAPLGVIPLDDYNIVEIADALLEAPRVPDNDVEGAQV